MEKNNPISMIGIAKLESCEISKCEGTVVIVSNLQVENMYNIMLQGITFGSYGFILILYVVIYRQ